MPQRLKEVDTLKLVLPTGGNGGTNKEGVCSL
jgi:hypothetical protein